MKHLRSNWRTAVSLLSLPLLFTLGVTIARSFRHPNEFAKAYWLLDYQLGFMKRALVGSIFLRSCELLGIENKDRAIVQLSTLLLLIFMTRVFFMLKDFAYEYPHGKLGFSSVGLALALIAATSPGLVMLTHLIGYLDFAIYLFAFLAIRLALQRAFLLSGLVQCLGILTHEAYLLMGLPLVFVCVYVESEKAWKKRLRNLFLSQLPPLLTFAFLAIFQKYWLNAPELEKALLEHLGKFPFIQGQFRFVSGSNSTSFHQLLSDQAQHFWHRISYPPFVIGYTPTIVAFLLYAHQQRALRPFNLLSLMAILASLAPFLENLVAWDTERFAAAAAINAMVVCWLLVKNVERSRSETASMLLLLPGILALNIFWQCTLMDGEIDNFSIWERFFFYCPAIILMLVSLVSKKMTPREFTT